MWYGKIEDSVLVYKQRKPGEGLVPVPNDAVCGMIYNEGLDTWSTPDIPISDIKSRAIKSLTSAYDSASKSLIDVYLSEFERLTWHTQVIEASMVNSSGSPGSNPVPFFDAFILANPDFAGEGSTDNENRALLKSVIESNNEQFASAAGNLIGQLSKKRYEIINSSNETEVNAVDMSFDIPSVELEDKF